MKKTNYKSSTFVRKAMFSLSHEPSLSGRRSIFIATFGKSFSRVAYSKATARRLAKQLREAADWVDRVWK